MVKRSGQEPPKPGPEQKDRDEAGRAAQPQVDGVAQQGLARTASGTWVLARVNDESLAAELSHQLAQFSREAVRPFALHEHGLRGAMTPEPANSLY